MDERTYVRTNNQSDARTHERTNARTHERTHGCTASWSITPIANMEGAKKAVPCRGNVVLALGARTTLPCYGTTILVLLCRRRTHLGPPYAIQLAPLSRRPRRAAARRGPEPQCGSSPSWGSGAMGWLQTNRGDIDAPSDRFLLPGNPKMLAPPPCSASALADDVAGAWAQICALF